MKPTISIIIPTFNNPQFLNTLKTNLKFFQGCEIIIVNDNPEKQIKMLNTSVQVIQMRENKGFSLAVNKGISQAKGDFIMLLNDDVVFNDNSYKDALHHFVSDKNLFAVTFAQVERDNTITGKNRLYWKEGFIRHSASYDKLQSYNGWAEGGSSIFDSTKLKSLNGFDDLFSPFYWEDIDLSYRAKKAGYKILFNPKIKVIHHHETTIGKLFSKDIIETISYRNQLICIWKNITSPNLLLNHIVHLFILILKSILKRDKLFLLGLIKALIKLPKILRKRKNISNLIPDYEIL